ncbi:MAG TPA: serine/threonine-protein kinase [Gemmatimonadales bacterium]|nr:serine/threonine-protein kinase [Gemmatimonadales bacterium]
MNGNEQQDASKELADLQRALASAYRVERLLVRRGTTIVYQAAELNPPRPVALRIFPAELGLAPAAARFREAAQAAVRLTHPNVVPLYRMGTRAGVPFFIATKLVEGRSLEDVVASQGALQVPLILAVLRAVASALAYAHGRNAVHGALTAANVLLDRNGAVAVADFGVGRVVEDAAAAAAGRTRFWTPEETAGGAPGPAGDQYALGLIALEMLTGSPQAAVDPLASDPLGALRDVRAARVAIPEPLVKVVQTALAPDPTRRFASAADLLAAIEAIPFSDADAREASVVLGRLARGEQVPKVRALSPPTAAVPRVSGSVAVPKAEKAPAAPTEFEVPALPAEEPAPAPPAEEPAPAPLVAQALPTPPAADAPFRLPSSPAMPAPAEPAPAAPIMRASRARESGHIAPAVAAPARAPARRSRVVPALAALLVLAVVAGTAYWLGRRSAQAPAVHAQPAAAPVAPSAPRVAAVAESARADSARPAAAAAEPAKAAAAPAAPKTGVLLINARPRTAFFFLDDKPVGRRGRLDSAVTAGRRHLEIVASGYQGWDTVIVVPAGDTLDLGEVPLDSSSAGQPAPAPKDTGGP